MQTNIPFINDFWQYRMNRLSNHLEEPELIDICNHFWKAHRQDKRQLTTGNLDFEVHTFDKGLKYRDAFIDISISRDPFMHKYRLLSGHTALRTAMARGEFRKILGVIPGNFRDLGRDEIDKLCLRMVDWFDAVGNLYAAPFSQSADILRNWLKGVYSGVPNGSRPCLFAIEHLLSDRRSLIIETANSLVSSLIKQNMMQADATIAVLGAGLFAESVAVTLGLNGYNARQFPDADLANVAEVTMLVDAGVRVKEKDATLLHDTILIEMLPEQIDPSADRVLYENGVIVIPDMLTSAAEEMVEKWLLTGEGVDTWQHCLSLMINELLQELIEISSEMKICHASAALYVAISNLKDKLIGE